MFKQLIFLLLLFSPLSEAASSYLLDNIKDKQIINDYWQLSVAGEQALSINAVVELDNSLWQRKHQAALTVSGSKNGSWFLIELANRATKEKVFYFSMANHPLVVKTRLYSRLNDEKVVAQSLLLSNSNIQLSHLSIPAKSKLVLYLYVLSEDDIKLTANIYDKETFINENNMSQLSSGIAIGGMICLALVELLWFFASGLKSALLLTGYFITRALLLSVILGWNIHYLLPDLPHLRAVDLPILSALSSVLFLWFVIELFNLSHEHPKLARVIRYFCWFNLLYIPLVFWLPIATNLSLMIVLYITESLLLIYTAIRLIRRHNRLGNLLAIISVLQLIFIIIIVSSSFWLGITILEFRNAVFYSAFWVNGLLISFLLSRQYYYEIKEKEIAQRQALENAINSKNAQNELIALQKETQELLEQHVQERTLELNIALQELEAANQELARKNTLDELTGLNNRRYYDQKIQAEFRRSKRNLTSLSIVLIDIDHFKKINDTYGHQAGDYCLQQLGSIIKESLRRSADIGCRYGGEEFCLILPDTDTLGAIEFAESLRQKVSQTKFEYDDRVLNITISCGVSTYNQQPEASPEKIFAAADKALYLAKNNGRNQTWQFAIEDL